MCATTETTYVEPDPDDPTGRLAAYLERTQTPLDILALLTLWIVVVPPGDFGSASDIAFGLRLALSGVYALDLIIRACLARRHWHYVLTHPLGLLFVAIPPLRVVFSLRLIRTLFRRGHLERFLLAAFVLILNGAVATYLYERHAAGSDIHTLGQSVWFAMTTVSTVGYGDYAPVTVPGRITAVAMMAIGVVTLAVLTAQIASSFVAQAPRSRSAGGDAAPGTSDVSLADLTQRLARIEALLAPPEGRAVD